MCKVAEPLKVTRTELLETQIHMSMIHTGTISITELNIYSLPCSRIRPMQVKQMLPNNVCHAVFQLLEQAQITHTDSAFCKTDKVYLAM
jgi:hypothetical protein